MRTCLISSVVAPSLAGTLPCPTSTCHVTLHSLVVPFFLVWRAITPDIDPSDHHRPEVDDMAAAVFSVPELLEDILSRLPMTELLLSQRVSKQFKATIEGSVKLQRALFFTPTLAPIAKRTSQTVDIKLNPLLTHTEGHRDIDRIHWFLLLKLFPTHSADASYKKMYLCQSDQPVHFQLDTYSCSLIEVLEPELGLEHVDQEYRSTTLGEVWHKYMTQRGRVLGVIRRRLKSGTTPSGKAANLRAYREMLRNPTHQAPCWELPVGYRFHY